MHPREKRSAPSRKQQNQRYFHPAAGSIRPARKIQTINRCLQKIAGVTPVKIKKSCSTVSLLRRIMHVPSLRGLRKPHARKISRSKVITMTNHHMGVQSPHPATISSKPSLTHSYFYSSRVEWSQTSLRDTRVVRYLSPFSQSLWFAHAELASPC